MGTRNISYSSKLLLKKGKTKNKTKQSNSTTINGVLVFYFCITNYPPNLAKQLKRAFIFSVSVNVANLILWLRVSHRLQSKVLDKAAVISRFDWERICLQAHSSGCWQDSVPVGCCTEDLSSSLVTSPEAALSYL